MREIGAFEAKAQFSRLLAEVRLGRSFTITHRGRAIARLAPVAPKDEVRTRAALERLQRRAANIASSRVSEEEIRAWRDEGRR
jgi:prevent-host-death family protein